MENRVREKLNIKRMVAMVLALLFCGVMADFVFADGELFPDDIELYYQLESYSNKYDSYYYSKDGSVRIASLSDLDSVRVAYDKTNYCYIDDDGCINMSCDGKLYNDIGKDIGEKFELIIYFYDNLLIATTESDVDYYYYDGKLISKSEKLGFYNAVYQVFDDDVYMSINKVKLINKDNIYVMEYNDENSENGDMYRVKLDGSRVFIASDVEKVTILPNDLSKYYIKCGDGKFYVYDISSSNLKQIDENVFDYMLYGDGTYYIVKYKTILIDLTKLIDFSDAKQNKMPSLFDKAYISGNYTNYVAYEKDVKEYNKKKEKNNNWYKDDIRKVLSYSEGYNLKLYDIYYYDGVKNILIAKDLVHVELEKNNTYDKNIVIDCTKWDEHVKMGIGEIKFEKGEANINDIINSYFEGTNRYIVNKNKATSLNIIAKQDPSRDQTIRVRNIWYANNDKLVYLKDDSEYWGNKSIDRSVGELIFKDKDDAIMNNKDSINGILASYKNFVLISKDNKLKLYDMNDYKLIYEYDIEGLHSRDIELYKNGFLIFAYNDKKYEIKYVNILENKVDLIANDIHEYNIERPHMEDYRLIEVDNSVVMNEDHTMLGDDFTNNVRLNERIEKLKEKNLYVPNESVMYTGSIKLSDDIKEIARQYSIDISKYNNSSEKSDESVKDKGEKSKNSFEIEKVEEIDFRFKLDLKNDSSIPLFLYYPVIKDNTGKFTAQTNYLNEILKNQRPVFVETIEKTLEYQSKNGLCCIQNFELEYDNDSTLNIYFKGYLKFDAGSEKYNMKYVMKYNLNECNYQFIDLN